MLTSIAFVGNAQISKGAIYFGTGISGSFGKVKYEGGSSYTRQLYLFNPSVGKAVSANTIVGFEGAIGHADLNYTSFRENISWGGGLFARRYMPITKSLYLFGQAGASYVRTTSKNNGFSDLSYLKANELSLYVTPGVSLLLPSDSIWI
jgi:hypothetical protein